MEKPKILIIDDDEALCESLVDILELQDYIVDTSHNAGDGQRKIESGFYNIVLLDMKLPDSDGIEVLRKIKAVSPDTEVIIFTAFAEMGIVIKAMDRNAFSFLPKPYEIPYLLTTIKRALEKQMIVFENRILFQQTVEEEREWKSTFDSISDLISIHDSDFNIIKCNKAVIKKLNVEFRDIIGKKYHEVFYGRNEPWKTCPFVRCKESLKPESDEKECMGGVFLMTCFPILDEAGKFNGAVHIARDITMHKRADEVLRQYECIVSATSDMMALLDTDYTYLSVNSAYAKAFNLTQNEVVGKTIHEVLGEKFFKDVIKPNVDRCLAGKEVSYHEWFNFPAYQLKLMDVHYYPYKDEDGNINGIVVNARDITERKHVEDAMNTLVMTTVENEGQKFFEQTVSSLYDWLGVDCVILGQLIDENIETTLAMKLDGKFVDNLSYELQGSPCGVVSKKDFCFYPEGVIDLFPDDKTLVQWNIEGYVGVSLKDKSGNCIGTLCALSHSRLELPSGAENVFKIISARASVELERMLSEKRVSSLARILEESLNEVFIFDADTLKFLQVNKGARENLGYSNEELMKLTPIEIKPEFTRESFEKKIEPLRSGEKEKIVFQSVHQRKDGSLYDVEIHLQSSTFESAPAIVAIILDITDRKKAERALQQQIQQLTVLNRLGQQISTRLSLDQLVQAALGAITVAVNPDLALFFLRDGDKLNLQGMAPTNSKYCHDETPVHRVGECLCGLSVTEGKPMYSDDILNDPRCTWEECKKAGLRSFAALPMFSGDKIIGVLGVAFGTQHEFEKQSEFLQILSNSISTGLQNTLLQMQEQRNAEELEAKVEERTKELTEANVSLEEKNREHERYNKVFVEREFRIKELRDKIKELEE